MVSNSLLKSAKKISTRIINLSLVSIIGLSSLVVATPLLFSASASALSPSVNGYATIQEAIDNAGSGATITLSSGTYQLNSQIRIVNSVHIIGAGDSTIITVGNTAWANATGSKGYAPLITISAGNNAVTLENIKVTGASNITMASCEGTISHCTDYGHGVNVVSSSNVTLNNVTSVSNQAAGLIVNGSNVTANNLITGNNGWHSSVNVDPGSGVITPSVFTLNSGNLADATQIWSDGSHVNVSAIVTVNAPGYRMYKYGGMTTAFLWTNRALTNAATITNNSVTTIYGTIIAAVKASQNGDTIKVAPGNYNLIKDDTTVISGQTGWYLPITKNNITLVGIDANNHEITDATNAVGNIYSTQVTANGNWSTQNLITVFGDNVSIKGLGIMNKIEPNKAIEVLGNNFTAVDDQFLPVPLSLFTNANNYGGDDLTKYGSGVYLNNNGATAARVATITNNIFKNSGVTFDSFGSNWMVDVSHNVFDGNKIWTSGGVDYYYSAIGSTTWANQPDFTGSNININYNQFINMSNSNAFLKIKVGMTGIFNAVNNYWGSTNPDFSLLTLGNVAHSPWYTTSDMNIPVTSTTSLGGPTPTEILGEIPQSIVTSDAGTVKVDITTGTVVTGPAGWDGIVSLPVPTSTFVITPDPGHTFTPIEAISIGAGDTHLTLDQPVKLDFVNQAGKQAGWSQAGVFHKITAVCDSATAPTLSLGADCKINDGADLIVWTKHFTAFVVYTDTTTAVTTTTTSATTTTQNYVVIAGDTLSDIGIKFGVDWNLIANYNGIDAPYTIYPGQVLKLATSNVVTPVVVTAPTEATPTPGKVLGDSISPQIGTAASTVASKPASTFKAKWYYLVVAVVLASVTYFAYKRFKKSSKEV